MLTIASRSGLAAFCKKQTILTEKTLCGSHRKDKVL